MDNFFSTDSTIVPNGYIYTSHTGAKYVFVEGFWFNDSNMLMVDPKKYPSMYSCARQQIVEHNLSSSEYKIGKTYIVEGKTCTFIGENRFDTKDGILLTEGELITELMADDHRVYNVSKETLQKEWNALQFYILPPYADDISIPAGMEVSGFKFIPKNHRFVDIKSGRAVDPAMTRKLSDEGLRIARQLAPKNKLIPIKSTLVKGNTRCEWNGKDFCDMDGNVVIPEQNAHAIINAYQQFVKSNPQDFPSLTGEDHQEQRFGSGEKPEQPKQPVKQPVFATKESINEADEEVEETESITVPDGYRITSNKNKTYIKQKGTWVDVETKKQLNTSASKSVERAAQRSIFAHNNSGAMKIGTKVKSKSGKEYSYIGGNRFVGADGKLIPKTTAEQILARYEEERSKQAEPEAEEEVEQEVSSTDNAKEPEAAPAPDTSNEEPKAEPEAIPAGGDEVQSLASKIKESPYAKKIKVLLTRGDEVSLIAADILLSGKKDETVQILKSLNNND